MIELALAADAHDEAARAVVNYLWSAALLGPLEPVEQVVSDAVRNLGVGLAAEAYEQYLAALARRPRLRPRGTLAGG